MTTTRLAHRVDLPQMLDIYRFYIETSSATFDTKAPTLREFEAGFTESSKDHPWLVSETDGLISGYAYASPFKNRSAYQWSVESTVYVRNGAYRQGTGRRLYTELIDRLKAQGIVNVVGVITIPNEASIALHEGLGFVQAGHFKNIGYKLNQWWDVGYWQLQLNRPENPTT